MTLRYSHTINRYDATTGFLELDVVVADDAFTHTVTTAFWLPISSSATVPTGSSLSTIINQWGASVVSPESFARIKALEQYGGVANAANLNELNGIPSITGTPVVIYPDRAYNSNPSANVVVRSTIVTVADMGTSPFVYTDYSSSLPDGAGIIDSGNVYGTGSRSTIAGIVQIGSDAAEQSITITGSINGAWPIGQSMVDGNSRLMPPQYIIDQFPLIVDGSNPNASYRCYYIEHTPLTITTSIAGGYFNYS